MTLSKYLLPLVLAVPSSLLAQEETPKPLRVLLVGHNPDAPKVVFPQLAKPRTKRLYRERTAAWEALLRYHFEHVQVVHGNDYKTAMSEAVDVTIFDCRPKPLPAPNKTKSGRPLALPESFDRPAILIAENAPLIGEPIGLKLDWL